MQPENSCDAGIAPATLDEWEHEADHFSQVAETPVAQERESVILALIAEVRRLKAAQADAWTNGFHAGVMRPWPTPRNPYREEESDG